MTCDVWLTWTVMAPTTETPGMLTVTLPLTLPAVPDAVTMKAPAPSVSETMGLAPAPIANETLLAAPRITVAAFSSVAVSKAKSPVRDCPATFSAAPVASTRA